MAFGPIKIDEINIKSWTNYVIMVHQINFVLREIMSATTFFSNQYGLFYWGCAKFAVSPYTRLFKSAMFGGKSNNDLIANGLNAVWTCAALTFVVPVLPAFTTLTFCIAALGMALALSSMFLTYPVGFIIDTVAGNDYIDNAYVPF